MLIYAVVPFMSSFILTLVFDLILSLVLQHFEFIDFLLWRGKRDSDFFQHFCKSYIVHVNNLLLKYFLQYILKVCK